MKKKYFKEFKEFWELNKSYLIELEELIKCIDKENDKNEEKIQEYYQVLSNTKKIISNPVYQTLAQGDHIKQLEEIEEAKDKYFLYPRYNLERNIPMPFGISTDDLEVVREKGHSIEISLFEMNMPSLLNVSKEAKAYRKYRKEICGAEIYKKSTNYFYLAKLKKGVLDKEIKHLTLIKETLEESDLINIINIVEENYLLLKRTIEEVKFINTDSSSLEIDDYAQYKGYIQNL